MFFSPLSLSGPVVHTVTETTSDSCQLTLFHRGVDPGHVTSTQVTNLMTSDLTRTLTPLTLDFNWIKKIKMSSEILAEPVAISDSNSSAVERFILKRAPHLWPLVLKLIFLLRYQK